MKRLSLRKLLPWLVVVAVLAFAVYRLKFRPMPVTAHTVGTGEVRGEVMGTGTLEARVKTTISPRIQERLAEVFVDQGDAVKAGQMLARLDDAELKQQVAIAEAALASARATVERVRADEARANAVLQQAQLDHKRVADLVATKIATQSDFDKAVESLRVAEADLKRSQAAIVEAQSQVFTAEKNLLYRREQMAFTEIRSPYDGLITKVLASMNCARHCRLVGRLQRDDVRLYSESVFPFRELRTFWKSVGLVSIGEMAGTARRHRSKALSQQPDSPVGLEPKRPSASGMPPRATQILLESVK